jgi:hypothetical protein
MGEEDIHYRDEHFDFRGSLTFIHGYHRSVRCAVGNCEYVGYWDVHMKMLGYVGSCLLFRVTMLLGDLNVCFF